MDNNSQVAELKDVYNQMDMEGKKMMVTSAAQLFSIQQNVTCKSRASRFNGIPGYFMMGFLLIFAAHFFWVTLISPALFMIGITPLVMVRIIITASIGMFCIGMGLFRFMFWKLSIPWMLLAIGAGVLCVYQLRERADKRSRNLAV